MRCHGGSGRSWARCHSKGVSGGSAGTFRGAGGAAMIGAFLLTRVNLEDVMGEERFGEFVLVRRHGEADDAGEGDVAELVLDRPKAMNAVSTEMARSVAAACSALGGDEGVRVVVVTSTHERAFCVGADLKERNSFSDAEPRRQRPGGRGA